MIVVIVCYINSFCCNFKQGRITPLGIRISLPSSNSSIVIICILSKSYNSDIYLRSLRRQALVALFDLEKHTKTPISALLLFDYFNEFTNILNIDFTAL
jgi:hypothetical protein